MFLNFGASLHGHEFSPAKQEQQNTKDGLPRPNPLLRSSFSTPAPTRNTGYEHQVLPRRRPDQPPSELTSRPVEHTVRFQEPEHDTMSDDGISAACSDSELSTNGRKRRRHSIRTSTTFHLAHPAPTLTQKQRFLQIRPKLLLQLQQTSSNTRPKPCVDVLLSTVVVPRLAKRFPRMFRGEDELGCNDVMVVKSEDYDNAQERVGDESDSDEDSLASRDLLAVICQMPKEKGGSQGKAEIVLSDGSIWIAEPLPTGSYEFHTSDSGGNKVIARWVKRNNKRASVDMSESVRVYDDIKYTFSIIDPTSRRHPILATIDKSNLDLSDSFTSLSRSSGRFPPTSPIRTIPAELDIPLADELLPDRTTHTIDERTKTLIQVTGIWVALRQGWSPYFRYNDALASVPTTIKPGSRAESSSLIPDPLWPSLGVCLNTLESNHSALGAVLGSKIRRVSVKGRPANATAPQSEQQVIPKRSVSAGTAFMQRAVARRVGTTPNAVASESEGESFRARPPRRAVTENVNGGDMSIPPRLTISGSPSATPETPTHPARRTQSVHIPHSALQIDCKFTQAQESGKLILIDRPSTVSRIKKNSRWLRFTNIFRRTDSASRSD